MEKTSSLVPVEGMPEGMEVRLNLLNARNPSKFREQPYTVWFKGQTVFFGTSSMEVLMWSLSFDENEYDRL